MIICKIIIGLKHSMIKMQIKCMIYNKLLLVINAQENHNPRDEQMAQGGSRRSDNMQIIHENV